MSSLENAAKVTAQSYEHTVLASTLDVGAASAGWLAHEFNNLLTIITMNLDALSGQPLSKCGLQQLGRAEWASRRAERLASQVLSLKGASDVEIIDLNQLAQRFLGVANDMTGGVAALDPCDRPVYARANHHVVEMALVNLVRNANQASVSGTPIVIRTTRGRSEGPDDCETVAISVTDAGCGMSAEAMGRLGEGFFTTKAAGQGSGFGLWIVQRSIAAFGGRLTVMSEVGFGTTMTLVFLAAGAARP